MQRKFWHDEKGGRGRRVMMSHSVICTSAEKHGSSLQKGEGLHSSTVSLDASHTGGGGHGPHPHLPRHGAGTEHGGRGKEGQTVHWSLVTAQKLRNEGNVWRLELVVATKIQFCLIAEKYKEIIENILIFRSFLVRNTCINVIKQMYFANNLLYKWLSDKNVFILRTPLIKIVFNILEFLMK